MQHNEDSNSVWLPSQNKSDEELPPKQRLDAESEVTDTPSTSSVQPGKELEFEVGRDRIGRSQAVRVRLIQPEGE